ncbi:hypothetical protein RHECNPAF_890077 [Rhizobium etli CNPAF512]|nr:hypothetical protein RHECNPAF_890077 [Rhizobium etli CNPAF512]
MRRFPITRFWLGVGRWGIRAVRVIIPIAAVVFIVSIIRRVNLGLGMRRCQEEGRSKENQQSHSSPLGCYKSTIGPNSMASSWRTATRSGSLRMCPRTLGAFRGLPRHRRVRQCCRGGAGLRPSHTS